MAEIKQSNFYSGTGTWERKEPGMINDLYHTDLKGNPRTAQLVAKLQPADIQKGYCLNLCRPH